MPKKVAVIGNIFEEARQLLREKSIMDLAGEELLTVKAAMIPLNMLPEFDNLTPVQGLKALANMYDKAARKKKR